MELLKMAGIPLADDLPLEDMPHTISYALIYRSRINSFYELPKNKRPPRNLWDKPAKLSEFFDEIFDTKGENKKESYLEYDFEDVE